MRIQYFLAVLLAMFFYTFAWAEPKPQGGTNQTSTQTTIDNQGVSVGMILGSPTGLSVGYQLNRMSAIHAALGVPFDSDVHFQIHGDYVWEIPTHAKVPGQLSFYIGLGSRIRVVDDKHTDKAEFGIRIPMGVEFLPNKLPITLFAEIAPVTVLTVDRRVTMDGGVGVRYRF